MSTFFCVQLFEVKTKVDFVLLILIELLTITV